MRRWFHRVCPFPARDLRSGTGVAPNPVVSSVRTLPRRREAGVTLIEALVVLAILGLVTAVVAVPMNSYWQRSRLQSTAGDVRNFLQTAYTEAVNQHTDVTVYYWYDNSINQWTLQVFPPPPAPRTQLGTYLLPSFVSLAWNPAANAGGWPSAPNPSGATGTVRGLVCSTTARTLIPTTTDCSSDCKAGELAGGQTLEVKTLRITHSSMVDGSLRPDTRYDIQVFPVWNVSYQKVVL